MFSTVHKLASCINNYYVSKTINFFFLESLGPMEWVCDIRNPNLRSGQTSEQMWRDYRAQLFRLLEKSGIDTNGLSKKYDSEIKHAA